MNPDLQNSSQNHNMKPHLNQMAQEFTPQSAVLRKQQIQQVQVQQQMAAGNFQQQQQAGAPGFNQQAALQAAIMNPAALQQVLQQQNPQLLHHFQQQQLQQLQQLHQQNLRLAAAFNQNQVGIFNATSALLQQIPNQPNERSGQKSVADVTNNDFEHFPTRDDTPSPQPVSGEQQPPKKQKSKASKDHNKVFIESIKTPRQKGR